MRLEMPLPLARVVLLQEALLRALHEYLSLVAPNQAAALVAQIGLEADTPAISASALAERLPDRQ